MLEIQIQALKLSWQAISLAHFWGWGTGHDLTIPGCSGIHCIVQTDLKPAVIPKTIDTYMIWRHWVYTECQEINPVWNFRESLE